VVPVAVGAGDRPAEHDERLKICNGERGLEKLVESADTCRTSSSIWAVNVMILSPDEDTRTPATQRGGVTSTIFFCQLGHIIYCNLSMRGNYGLNIWRQAISLQSAEKI
jgi:hypothetical protein